MTIAKILINGTDSYLLAGGKDLGNFAGPGFAHKNVKARAPATPKFPAMRIYIRNDLAPATRGEAVIELFASGDLAGAVAGGLTVTRLPAGITAQDIMTPFTIEAFDASGNPVADYLGRTVITAPTFWWGARYIFKTARRPIIRTPAQISSAAKTLAPARSRHGIPGKFDNTNFSKYNYVNPMDLAGVEPGGGTTGERYDIGEETEIVANYEINPTDSVAINAMLSWGDAANTWPIYWRDDATDAPINKATYPKTNNYGWPSPNACELPGRACFR